MHAKLVVVAAAALAGVATGAFAQTRGVTKTEIMLGMPTDLSGVTATCGVSSSNAVRMRFEEINAAGGIHGRKINLIVEDHGYQVPKAGAGLQQADQPRQRLRLRGGAGHADEQRLLQGPVRGRRAEPVTRCSAARSMYEPFDRLKFYGAATYVDQIRSAVNYFVKEKGKKAICVMYQDTDFGKEIVVGAELQTKQLGIKIVEMAAHKPTDQDFTASLDQAQGSRLRPGPDGHHRARLHRSLHHGAQHGLDRR